MNSNSNIRRNIIALFCVVFLELVPIYVTACSFTNPIFLSGFNVSNSRNIDYLESNQIQIYDNMNISFIAPANGISFFTLKNESSNKIVFQKRFNSNSGYQNFSILANPEDPFMPILPGNYSAQLKLYKASRNNDISYIIAKTNPIPIEIVKSESIFIENEENIQYVRTTSEVLVGNEYSVVPAYNAFFSTQLVDKYTQKPIHHKIYFSLSESENNGTFKLIDENSTDFNGFYFYNEIKYSLDMLTIAKFQFTGNDLYNYTILEKEINSNNIYDEY